MNSPLRKFGESLLGSSPGLAAQSARDSNASMARSESQLVKQDALDYRRARRLYRKAVRNEDASMISAGLRGMEQFESAKSLGTGIQRAEAFQQHGAASLARRNALLDSIGGGAPAPIDGKPSTISQFASLDRSAPLAQRREAAASLMDEFITAREMNPNADIRGFVARAEQLGLGAGQNLNPEARQSLFINAAGRRLRQKENASAARPVNTASLFRR